LNLRRCDIQSETFASTNPVIYWAETSQSIQDIPKWEVIEGGLGCTLVSNEERIWGLASRVNGEKVAIECDGRVSGLNGYVGPIHDTRETAAVVQQVSRVVVVVAENGR
jgi:hypothetical protein